MYCIDDKKLSRYMFEEKHEVYDFTEFLDKCYAWKSAGCIYLAYDCQMSVHYYYEKIIKETGEKPRRCEPQYIKPEEFVKTFYLDGRPVEIEASFNNSIRRMLDLIRLRSSRLGAYSIKEVQ